MQTSTAHSDHSEVGSLFRLVASHLECAMGVLTLHATHRDQPNILAAFNMPEALASRIARSIQQAVGFDAWQPEKISPPAIDFGLETGYSPEPAGDVSRHTFFCRVEPSTLLALSACRVGPYPPTQGKQTPQTIQGWVDSHLRLLWQVQRDRDRAAFLGQALDLFDFTTILLDTDGNILFANEQALRLLDAGEGLRRAGQSITATDFDNAVRLQTAIQYFNHCDENLAVPEAGRVSVMLLRRSNARPLVAALSRIPNGHEGSAATVLHVLDPDSDTQSLVAALCRAYGLTATEACLAIHLVEGMTIEGAAHEMRVQTQTARAYLKQVFSKTDTHRQADLVRVMLNSVVRIKAAAISPSNGGNGSSRLRAERLPVWG